MKRNGVGTRGVPNGTHGSIPFTPTGNSPVARMTILIPAAVDQNLEICRLKLGISKNEVIKRALRDFVRANKLDPDKTPKALTVSY